MEEKSRKDCDRFIRENPYIVKSDSNLMNTIKKIENDIPPCDKCNSTYVQLWGVNGDIFQYRCENCKKIHELNEKTTPNKLYDLNFNLLHLIQLIDKINEHVNDKAWGRLKGYLVYDYFSLRNGTLLMRAVKFKCRGTPKSLVDINYNNSSRRISQKVKDMVWRRDEGKCVECGSNERLEFDHIIPHSRGGSNTYRNIQLLCEPCNRNKSAKIG